MAQMRETKGSISLYFILAGALSAFATFRELRQLSGAFQGFGSLSPVERAFLILELFFLCAAVVVFGIGVKYESVVKALPYLVPSLLVVLVVLNCLAAALFPLLLIRAILSALVYAYLFFQNRRITKEITQGC
jgi:hypothetical protein